MALSLLNTNEVQVARMVKALYNAAPGYTFMTNFSSYATAKGMNGLAEGLVADFAANDNATLAAAVASNLGLTGTALTAGTAYLQGQFESMGAAKRGQVILDAVNGLSTLTADATYGAAATAFNDSVATSVTYSSNSSNNSTVLATLQAAAVPTGNTVALVAGTDNATGTTLADTFTGTLNSTLTSVDRINGSSGNDILKATLSTVTTTVQPLAVTDVETIRVSGVGSSAANTLSVKYATGLTLLEFNDVTTTGGTGRIYTITDITSAATPLAVKTVTSVDTTVNFTHAAAGLTGAADTVSLTLQDVGAVDAYIAAVQVNTAGIEALTVSSNGAANYITNLTATSDLKALTITGAAALNVTTLGGAGSKLVSVDASAATGAVNIDTSFAANLKVTGGSANDTFVFAGNLDVNDTVDGGSGVNTISVGSADGNAIATNVTLANIQSLTLNADADQLLSQANLAAITSVTAVVPTNTTTALTGGTAGAGKHTLTYLGAASDSALTYALTSNTSTSADKLTVNVGSVLADGTDRGAITANEIETLSISSSSLTATTANTLGITAQSAAAVNLSGTALTIDATDFASEVIVNASAMTGILTIGSETSTDQTIIGGSANDAISFTASHLNSNDSVDGGAGNDTVTIAKTMAATTSTFGRVAMTNVENLKMTIDVDDANTTALTHSIDLRNAPVSTLTVTTALQTADATPTNSFTISNLQAGLTKVTLAATQTTTGGTYTLDSDRLDSTNFVFTGTAAKSVTGLTLALTGDWTGFNMKQTGSAANATETFSSVTAPTSLTTLSIDSSEHATTISSLTANKLASLTITGDNTTTLTALSQTTAALASVDGSAASGNIVLTATTRTAAATVTTGSGDDSIELTLTTESGNTINAGTNSTVTSSSTGDTLVLNGSSTGATVIELATTTDQIVTINGVANAATQVGFEHVNASGVSAAGGTFNISAGTGINVITGGGGNDTIDGGAGNDTITGGGGVDVLTGGSGNDSFVISSTAAINGIDLITDFQFGSTAGSVDVINATGLAAFLNGATGAVVTISDFTAQAEGAANDNILLFTTGTYADAAALGAAGTTATAGNDFGASIGAAGVHVIVAYVSSITGNVRIGEATLADAGGFTSASVVKDLVELVGVTSLSSTLVAGNFLMD